ncbi:hypothetical protein VTN49DRAFT_4540 [Thermomyces lanuginosus]|uniref:uncharacterized protein n=1 Tax=Thermomyces lanuginosus TaxID=5541 RepID=UPI003742AF0D
MPHRISSISLLSRVEKTRDTIETTCPPTCKVMMSLISNQTTGISKQDTPQIKQCIAKGILQTTQIKRAKSNTATNDYALTPCPLHRKNYESKL